MRIIQSDNPRPLNLLAISSGGLIASASDTFEAGGGVEVWDASGSRIAAWSGFRACGSIAFDVTGEYVLFSEADHGITIVSVKEGRALVGLELSPGRSEFALFANGTRLLNATGAYSGGGVECWRFDPELNFTQLWRNGSSENRTFTAPAADPTGVRVAVVERYDGNDSRPRQEVSIREAASGEPTIRIPLDPASPVLQLAFTADGSKLLVRTEGRTVAMFDATTGAPAGELVHPRRPYVTAIAVHPRGPVACARTDGTVTFWDADKREQLKTLDWKAGKLVSLAFAPDGALAAAGTEDGKEVVWDVE